MAQDNTQNLFTEITTEESSSVNGGHYGYGYGYRRVSYYRPRRYYGYGYGGYGYGYRRASYGYGGGYYGYGCY